MEETLFESDGKPVAYIDYSDDRTIYLWTGEPVAYLDENSIFAFSGSFLGWYEDGIIWNKQGQKNGFNKNTLSSYAQYEPYKGYKSYKPYKGYQAYEPYKPYKQNSVSPASLLQFLTAG